MHKIIHLIVDRDGTLNEIVPAAVRRPEDFKWLPGVLEALATLRQDGVRVSVVTNQSAVSRGLMTEYDLGDVHKRMVEESDGAIKRVFFCPHRDEDRCDCRKPKPRMLWDAVDASRIPARNTLMVGDSECDIEAALNAGVRSVLVLTGHGRDTAHLVSHWKVHRVALDLLTLAREINR